LTAGLARAEEMTALTPEREAEVRAMMVELGYEVRSVGVEDGKIEVYAVKDGELVEVYLDETLAIIAGDADEE
jgi:Peptidase propeptide and YPEB domain